MDVFAKSIEAKDDLRTFVWDFGQEHNQVRVYTHINIMKNIDHTNSYLYVQVQQSIADILKRKKNYIFNFKLQYDVNAI